MTDIDRRPPLDDLPPEPFRLDLLAPDDYRAHSEALERWVTWLVARYRLHRVIRPCWWQHGAHVDELSALWVAWRGVHETPDREDAWCWWHDHLARMLNRMRDCWPTGCTDTHTEPSDFPWPRPAHGEGLGITVDPIPAPTSPHVVC